MHYAKTLNSFWYLEDICNVIQRSLQGCCDYYATSIDNLENRAAYVDTFNKCIKECNVMSPEKMIEALTWLKYDEEAYGHVPWVFSLERWTTNKKEFREKAIEQAMQIVTSHKTRYLDNF
jgi:hypothetical protein